MSAVACQEVVQGVGSSVAASLRAVDCAATAATQAAFGRLFGTDGALLPALTILLTLYIAFFAISLITGRSRLGISALTPRMVTLGLVLTFATSWIAYQNVVWNLAVGTPDQLAAIITGDSGATQVFADKVDIVMAKLIEAGGNGVAPTSTYSPLGLMWLGGTLFLLGTVGILVTAKIALAVLLALGPVFVVVALFKPTRGLFAGWIKAVVLVGIAPIFAVLGGSLMLELAVPVLSSLAPTLPGDIDPQSAMAFFLLSAVHCGLMILVLKVAGTMVAGWRVFGSASQIAAENGLAYAAKSHPAAPTPAITPIGSARAIAPAPTREIRLAQAAANDSVPVGATPQRTVVVGSGGPSIPSASANGTPCRARGVGSRFRTTPARMEKFK